jgi:hypothetical protein
METPKQCGISGKEFAPGDLYIEQTVPAEGDSAEYVRLVSVEAAGLTPEQIEAGKADGTVKTFEAPAA